MTKIGRYQITRELGRGAMGVVYHAIDPVIGRAVAIKTLRLHDLDDGDQRKRLRERLFREARSAGALSHPGIVTIYDMDEVDGLAYIAMEFVDGDSLEDLLKQPQSVARERVTEILKQAAAALDYAHRKGVIHRDIKPANIMIDRAGSVKITDFGIAKIAQVEGQTLTGVLIGTPNYMSPEQVQGHEIDGRSDQFSLAVIAYEMLAGERPFFGEQISTVVYKIVADQPVPIQSVNTTLSDGVDKAVRRGLAKKPEKRFASCTAFATAIDTALEAVKAWRVLPRKMQQNIPTAATAATDAITPRFKPVRKAPAPQVIPAQSDAVRSVRAKLAQPTKQHRSWVLSFVGAFVVLGSLLAVIAWRTGVLDITPIESRFGSPAQRARAQTPPPTPAAKPTSDREPAPDAAQKIDPTVVPPASDSDEINSDRPSPMPAQQASANPSAANGAKRSDAVAAIDAGPSTFQDVSVMTDPSDATATLDSSSEITCRTPCRLSARTGVHTVTVSKEGYQIDRREVHIGHEDLTVPLITLRSANGILVLTSEPSGANVIIDGRPTGQTTPVRVSLPAGNHSVAIEKDGLQSSGPVEIHNGDLATLKLTVRRQ